MKQLRDMAGRCVHAFVLTLFFSLPALAYDVPGDPDSLPGWLGTQTGFSGLVSTQENRPSGVDRSRIIQLSAEKPRAYLYKSFLSPAECDHLISKASPKLERSKVVGDLESPGKVSDIRTSFGTFFTKGQDSVVKAIEQRISEWTFLPTSNQEPLQVLRYMKGQKYVPHYDYFPGSPAKQAGGQRYATVLMYLSNVTLGGETVFPNVPDPTPKDDTWSECAKGLLAVKPQRGDALLFFSMQPDGSPDTYSLHYACPVLEGVKWSAPKWIRIRNYDTPYIDPSICENSNGLCEHWARAGECQKNSRYMIGGPGVIGACRKACGACTPKDNA